MLDWVIRNAAASALMPPGFLVLLGLCGLLLLKRRPYWARALLVASLVLLYALSTRLAADQLLRLLEQPWSDPLASAPAQAIVVLGTGRYFSAPEYAGHTVNAQGLVRLRYAARLHRATGTPILVTGGSPEGVPGAEAEAMAATLMRDFGVTVAWIEPNAHTTLDSARYARELLAPTGARAVYLVTHAWHMPRAVQAFQHSGFTVIPAPTGYATRITGTALDFAPDAYALADSSRWFHEILGIAWYRLQLSLTREPR